MLQHRASWEGQAYRTFPAIAEEFHQDYPPHDHWKTQERHLSSGTHAYPFASSDYAQSTVTVAPTAQHAIPRNEVGWSSVPQRAMSLASNDVGHTYYSPQSSHRSSLMQDMTRRSSTFSYPSSTGMTDHLGASSLGEASSNMAISAGPGTQAYTQHQAYMIPQQYSPFHEEVHEAGQSSMQPQDGHHYEWTWQGDSNLHLGQDAPRGN